MVGLRGFEKKKLKIVCTKSNLKFRVSKFQGSMLNSLDVHTLTKCNCGDGLTTISVTFLQLVAKRLITELLRYRLCEPRSNFCYDGTKQPYPCSQQRTGTQTHRIDRDTRRHWYSWTHRSYPRAPSSWRSLLPSLSDRELIHVLFRLFTCSSAVDPGEGHNSPPLPPLPPLPQKNGHFF